MAGEQTENGFGLHIGPGRIRLLPFIMAAKGKPQALA